MISISLLLFFLSIKIKYIHMIQEIINTKLKILKMKLCNFFENNFKLYYNIIHFKLRSYN